jgi:hypothetical protein
MAQISILRRSRSLSLPAAGVATDVVEVTYSTPAVPPRHVHLPFENYRPATHEELDVNPRYQMLPVNEAAAEAERQAIQADMKAAIGRVPESFESA